MASSFSPRPGCPLCSIVSTPYPSLLQSPRSPSFGGSGNNGSGAPAPQIVHKDDKVTVYLEKANPVSSKGHLVVVLNLHVPSLYTLSSSDLPLLQHMQRLAQSLLTKHINGTLGPTTITGNGPVPPTPISPILNHDAASQAITFSPETDPANKFEIGFIVSPFSDPKIPVTDHVHLHAYVGTMDLAGWWRKVNYSGMGWWAIDDLIAEIREQTSNNRVKSAYPHPRMAPINQVPDAGARVGLANGLEIPQSGIIEGPASPRGSMSPAPVPSVSVTGDDEEPTKAHDSEEETAPVLPRTGSASQVTTGKRPMGPRTKDSIPLGQVGSASPSPEPVSVV